MRVKLESVCEILDSRRIPITASDRKKGPYPYYGANGIQDYVDGYIFDDELVLLAEDGGNFGSTERPIAYRVSGKCWVNNHAHVLKPKECIDVDYLCYSLMFYDVSALVNGATRQKLTQADMRKMEIPIVSTSEQNYIVAKLNKISNLIAMRKKQLQKLDELVKARFVEMFDDESHPKIPLIQLIVEGAGLSYGIIVPGDNIEDGIPMVRPSDFKNSELCLDNVYKVAPEIEAKYARTRLIGDEVLVQVIGQPGQIMLSDSRCKGMNVTRNLAVVRPDCSRIDRIYLKTYMQTQEAQAFMLGETKQSTLKQLPLSRLKELEIPAAPMKLQKQFATFVEQTDKSKSTIQQSLDKLELLKKALMQKYFG